MRRRSGQTKNLDVRRKVVLFAFRISAAIFLLSPVFVCLKRDRSNGEEGRTARCLNEITTYGK